MDSSKKKKIKKKYWDLPVVIYFCHKGGGDHYRISWFIHFREIFFFCKPTVAFRKKKVWISDYFAKALLTGAFLSRKRKFSQKKKKKEKYILKYKIYFYVQNLGVDRS
jgi:hypothetical protein